MNASVAEGIYVFYRYLILWFTTDWLHYLLYKKFRDKKEWNEKR